MPTRYPIDDVSSIGEVRDTPSYMLPPGAWSTALNMRVLESGLETLLGWSQVFGTPGTVPHFIMPVVGTGGVLWLYSSLTKTFVYDGTTHTNITRQTAGVDVNYTANDTPDLGGTLLGGVPILCNGSDVPQYWPNNTISTKLKDLVNWPSSLRAKVVRAFGPYLVAFNLVDSAFTPAGLPHTIQWSHPADPGNLPPSWDYANPAVQAGRRDFSDINSGIILDALPLGQVMYVYKEGAIWKMRRVGGISIFDFGEAAWQTTIGLLAKRCVCVAGVPERHVLATQDDIIWHDGNTIRSILNRVQRRRLFNEMDTTTFGQSFIFDNPYFKEVWFCYPTSGSTYPNQALVMNYSDINKWVVTEADGITFRNATIGRLEGVSDETWDENEELWDDDTGPWSELQRRRVLIASPDNNKIYNFDKGVLRDAATITATLQRLAMSLDGKPVDFTKWKMLHRVWPKLTGGPVNIRFGSQEVIDGPVTWSPAVSFDPKLHAGHAVPGPQSGRAICIEYATQGSASWHLDGYTVESEMLGSF